MNEFDLKKAKELSPSELNNYITKYFYPLANGNHVMIENNIPIIYKKEIIKHTYFNRLPKKCNEFYFNDNCDIKRIVCEIGKPMIQPNSINICPPFLHQYKPYSEFSESAKEGVTLMLGYIKEIWANDRQDSFEFLIKWFSNMARGNKNTSILYCKSIQGTGKSTLTDFFMKHVIGSKLTLMCGSEPIKTRFNSALLSKLLVVFEELENSGVNEWQTISSNLKRHATSTTINIESKGVDSYETNNINNYIINTNVEAIKDSEGRRYYIVEINSKYREDYKFFNNIRQKCFNDEVGQAFFSYMHEIDLTNFNPESFPQSSLKADAVISRLDNVYMFLKSCFVLKNVGIICSVSELHKKYIDFCSDNQIFKPQTKINFNQKLKDININYYKSDSTLKFKITHEDLLKIALKGKWINDLDEYEYKSDKTSGPIDLVIKSKSELISEIEELKIEIERLKKMQDIKQVDAEQVEEQILEEDKPILKKKKKVLKIISVKEVPSEEKIKSTCERQIITKDEISNVYDLFNI